MSPVPRYTQLSPASPSASRVEQKNRREGGHAEQLLRQAVWRLGLRYHKHHRGVPGRPDMVFPTPRVVVFVDGDFWHGRDWPTLRARLEKRANPGYWIPKIARNRERDAEQTAALEAAGWHVIRVWETDVLRDPIVAAADIAAAVRGRVRVPPIL